MTGYTRQSVADIINGSNITAPPLNAEFNQLSAAFEGEGGHAHDGTAGNGPKINLSTSVTGYLMSANGGTGGKNNTTATTNPTSTSDGLAGYAPGSIWLNSATGRVFICAVNTNSAAVWLEVVGVRNGNSITPVSTNTVDIGSSAIRYKDLYLAGTALVGSLAAGPVSVDSLSVTGATTATGLLTANGGLLSNGVFTTTGTANLNGNVNIGDGTTDVVTFGGRISGNLVPSADDVSDLGTSTLEWRNIWVDGTANIDNLVADAVTVSGGTIDNTVIGGTTAQTVRGTTVTALTGFVGNLTGNVTGNTSGTHTGPVTGDVTGNVTGNVTAATGTSSFNNVTINGSLDLNAGTVGTITGLSTPVNATDAATKNYVDAAIANLINTAPGTLDTLNEIATALGNDPNFAATMTTELAKKLDKTGGTMTGAIAMSGNKVTGLGTPTAGTDAATKAYVDSVDAAKLSLSGGTMTGAIAMGANKITGLGAPTLGTDATTKDYVDGIVGSTASAATSAANAATSATQAATSASNAATSASQAAASYDSFDDRYLGPKSSDPTADNDGNALLVGALYWNTSSNEMRVWSGSSWLTSYLPASGYAQLSGATFTGSISAPSLSVSSLTSGYLVKGNGASAVSPSVIYDNGTNVGIGTASPGSLLHLNKASGAADLRFSVGGTLYAQMYASSSDTSIYSVTAAPLILGANNTEGVRIDASGNFGVNQPAPAGRLDISGNLVSNIVAVAASAIDCSAGNFFTKTAAGALTWTVTNVPASRAYSFILELTNGGTGTQTWFSGIKWPGGTAPTLVASGVDVLGFITDDGGTTWRGVQLMKDSK